MSQAPLDQAQPVAFGAGAEQHLGHGQADQGRVRQFGWASWSTTRAEQAGNGAVECLDEGVEIGVHEACVVDVADATPILGPLAAFGIVRRSHNTSESLI